jgi:hypothetical protein
LRKLNTAFGRAALERPLDGGYPIEGRDDFSPANVQKSVELSDLIAARLRAAFSRGCLVTAGRASMAVFSSAAGISEKRSSVDPNAASASGSARQGTP